MDWGWWDKKDGKLGWEKGLIWQLQYLPNPSLLPRLNPSSLVHTDLHHWYHLRQKNAFLLYRAQHGGPTLNKNQPSDLLCHMDLPQGARTRRDRECTVSWTLRSLSTHYLVQCIRAAQGRLFFIGDSCHNLIWRSLSISQNNFFFSEQDQLHHCNWVKVLSQYVSRFIHKCQTINF